MTFECIFWLGLGIGIGVGLGIWNWDCCSYIFTATYCYKVVFTVYISCHHIKIILKWKILQVDIG